MPYLTPQTLPESDDCRSLSIPASTDWLALFGGALTELTKAYNWEDSGGLTVAETVAKMNEIINDWYTEPCTQCTLPGGGKIIRITSSGHIEELDSSGNWGEPEGDYVIPPPDARTGGTSADQICLAAKNATNVLKQLYENLTDSYNDGLDEAEAATAFTLALIGLVGFEFAPITAGIVAFFGAVFSALYAALEFIVADLWDDAVSGQIECFLHDCAINTSGVVTFDWDCFMGALQSSVNSFSLTEDQLRLYLQIAYMLYFIGGVDGLNLAGRTTEITDDVCECAWCHTWELSLGSQDDLAITLTYGSITGNGIESTVLSGTSSVINAALVFPPVVLDTLTLIYHTGNVASGGSRVWAIKNGATTLRSGAFNSGTGDFLMGQTAINVLTDRITVTLDNNGHTQANWFATLTLTGKGENPFSPDNC